MIVIKSIGVIVLFFCLSLLLGDGMAIKRNQGNNGMAHTYIVGMLCMFSVFHVLAVLFTFLKYSLTALSVVYCVVLIGIIVCLYAGRGQGILRNWTMNIQIRGTWLKWMVFVLILFQVLYVCIYSHTDADDATYVGIATTSYFSDTLNQINPLTGDAINISGFADYILAPISLFWAMWAKTWGLHPAFLMHVLCPVILIPTAYIVYYLVAKVFFKEEKKRWQFLFFVNILNIWGNWAIRSTSTFLLFRIWQGKAVLAAILVPLTIYLMARIKTGDDAWDNWFLLFLNSISCCLVSGMGAILFPVLMLAYATPDLLMERKWKRIVHYFICMIPCMISAGLYIALKIFF